MIKKTTWNEYVDNSLLSDILKPTSCCRIFWPTCTFLFFSFLSWRTYYEIGLLGITPPRPISLLRSHWMIGSTKEMHDQECQHKVQTKCTSPGAIDSSDSPGWRSWWTPPPHLGTTSPINDLLPPSSRRQPVASFFVAPSSDDRLILLVAAPPSDHIACPEALLGVASPGQAQLYLDLALISFVETRSRIDHIKSHDKHTHEKLISKDPCHALCFPLYWFSCFLNSHVTNLTTSPGYIMTTPAPSTPS